MSRWKRSTIIDQVRLVAIDHPAATEVYPNERFLNEPPFASGRAVISTAAHPLAGAWDDKGRDVQRTAACPRSPTTCATSPICPLPALPTSTRSPSIWEQWTAASPLRLLLHGFIEYFSASSMYAAWQAGSAPMPPYVEAQLPDGSWKRVIDDMGFPAGLPRTIVVDLTGKLPPGRGAFGWSPICRSTGIRPWSTTGRRRRSSCTRPSCPWLPRNLPFAAIPKQIDGKTPGDLTYNYQHISQTGPFIPLPRQLYALRRSHPLLKSIDETS